MSTFRCNQMTVLQDLTASLEQLAVQLGSAPESLQVLRKKNKSSYIKKQR